MAGQTIQLSTPNGTINLPAAVVLQAASSSFTTAGGTTAITIDADQLAQAAGNSQTAQLLQLSPAVHTLQLATR